MSRNRNKSNNVKPVIDVVITTAGRFDMLEKCLDAVYREAQSTPLTISVIDIDSPTDERSQNSNLFIYQEEKDPAKGVVSFQTKRFTKNVGFPMGANEGARMGKSNLIMFLGDDVCLDDGAMKSVVEVFTDTTVGVEGVKLRFPDNSTHPQRPAGKVQHVGLALNIRGEPIHPLVGWSVGNPKTCISRDVWAVTGACFTIRRHLFSQSRGFDLVYGKGTFEDADLCMKVRQKGHRVYLNAKATGTHYVGASTEKRKEGFPLQQNLQIFQSKWGQSGLMVWSEADFW